MKNEFNEQWISWIRTNVERGCSRDELRRILIDAGFGDRAVQEALDPKAAIARGACAPTPKCIANLQRFPSTRIELYTAEGFLDPAECRDIVCVMQGRLRESTITTPDEPDRMFRRSLTCDLGLIDDPAVQRLEARMCTALGTTSEYAEPAQGQHYDPGGEFKPHTDAFEQHELERYSTQLLGQRSWTFMIYLNDVAGGGETAFVNAGLVLAPRTGLAVIWNNLMPDGRPNPDTLHHGMPVTAGHKDIVTKWFRMPRS